MTRQFFLVSEANLEKLSATEHRVAMRVGAILSLPIFRRRERNGSTGLVAVSDELDGDSIRVKDMQASVDRI